MSDSKNSSRVLVSIALLAALALACSLGRPTVPPPTAVEPPSAEPSPAAITGSLWRDLCFAAGSETSPPAGCVAMLQGGFQGNGARDTGEPAISGAMVTLGPGACPSSGLATTLTDPNGTYVFDGLSAGTYCVALNQRDPANAALLGSGAWTYPASGQGSATVSVLAGERRRDVNFAWSAQAVAEVPGETGGGDNGCDYSAALVAEVTMPDETPILAGGQFTKTWRLRNDGTCTWGPNSHALRALAFVAGERMGAPDLTVLPSDVPPGSVVDVSLTLTAPAAPGKYEGQWKLYSDPSPAGGGGPYLGLGQDGQAPLVVRILSVEASRITFASGATDAAVEGALKAGESHYYSLRALQDQTLMLTASSLHTDVAVTVTGQTGVNPEVVRSIPDGSFWMGKLPLDQDYIIQVAAGSQDTSFSMSVEVPRRIRFESGAAAAAVAGKTAERRTVTYLLNALAGQTMTVTLTSPNDAMGLTIYGLDDGTPLVRAVSGATTWTGTLPLTQDYVIKAVPSVAEAVDFTLTVSVK